MKIKQSLAIYARVSIDKQKADMQLVELRDYVKQAGWKIHKEFIEEDYTGKNTSRPAFKEIIDLDRQRKFGIL